MTSTPRVEGRGFLRLTIRVIGCDGAICEEVSQVAEIMGRSEAQVQSFFAQT